MTQATENSPEKEFRAGRIKASIWRNEGERDGQTVIRHSVTLQKRYQDSDGKWKNSSSFFVNDLPRVEVVMRKAFEYLALNKTKEEPKPTA